MNFFMHLGGRNNNQNGLSGQYQRESEILENLSEGSLYKNKQSLTLSHWTNVSYHSHGQTWNFRRVICQPSSIRWLAHGWLCHFWYDLLWLWADQPPHGKKENKASDSSWTPNQLANLHSSGKVQCHDMAGHHPSKKTWEGNCCICWPKINTTTGPTRAPPKKTLKSKHSFCISKSRMSTFMVGSVVLIPPTSMEKQKN